MALSFAELKAKMIEQQARKERGRSGNFGNSNAVYPFWNNPDGSTAVLRFLPDGDESNDFFWLERLIIKLPFNGVKGSADSKPVVVEVPCTDMWKAKSCPVTAEISPWWKDKALEDMARKYYRKKSYVFQGFVVSNPVEEETPPENSIRRFIINPSVFDRIKLILLAQDVETSPTDYDNGLDFYLTKTKQGTFANYDSSGWTKPGTLGTIKPRSLSDDERQAIETHGLWNLGNFLPKKPDEEHLTAIMELFNASVNDELYDMDRWGQLYSPIGMRFNNNSTETAETTVDATTSKVVEKAKTFTGANPASTAASILSKVNAAKNVEAVEETVEEVAQVVSTGKPKGQTPEEIIAAIKNRQQNKK